MGQTLSVREVIHSGCRNSSGSVHIVLMLVHYTITGDMGRCLLRGGQWVISQPHAELAHISCPVINVEEMLAGKTRPVMAVSRANGRNFPRPGPGDLASYRSLSDRISYFIFSMTRPFVQLNPGFLPLLESALLRKNMDQLSFYFNVDATLSMLHAERIK